MFIDYSQRQENSLFDLSLSLAFKKFLESLTSQKKEEEISIDITISFFKLIIDFCNKVFNELNNEFSGADAFSIFTSALNNLDMEVETIDDVLEEAEKYHDYLLEFKKGKKLNSDELEELILILEQINKQLKQKSKNNQMSSWVC